MRGKLLKDAADSTPDPQRALKNLETFAEENPGRKEELYSHLRDVAVLFSVSQFLSNYSIANPDILFGALRNIDLPFVREDLSSSLMHRIETSVSGRTATGRGGLEPFMNIVRQFRMRELLKITLRDILGKADLVETFAELSMLADVVIDQSLRVVREYLTGQYGTPKDDGFAVIALGKLGAEELNFSSDVDLMYVYGEGNGETSGVSTAKGITRNRISNHEYYCKAGESLGRFLSLNTESGFAYRVDMRLRPEGQRGALALPLPGYETYYESWGRAWERAMLIRARPVAGDPAVGESFMELIRPFVYRKYLDFSAIDEIKSLKTRIDATFKKGDIKRGYGGIREIEFFTQALQLIYGGREFLLRERSTLRTLHRLMQKSLIGQEDYAALADNYRFLRTVEHRLQQLNDLQTHTLPAGEEETGILARKLGLVNGKKFTEEIEKRRASVRRIYDSLFVDKKEASPVSGSFFDEDLSDSELRDYLQEKGLRDPGRAARDIRLIRESTYSFQTLRGRRLLSEILPLFVDSALRSTEPETVLNHLHGLSVLLSANESYLEIFTRDRGLIDMLVYLFSQSPYLARILVSRPKYLEMIGWQEGPRKSLGTLKTELSSGVSDGHSINDAARLVKQAEEIRLGLLFLRKDIRVQDVVRGLSRVAESVVSASLAFTAGQADGGAGSLAVIGFGKFGGREITFGSDLDMIFVSAGEPGTEEVKAAERLLRMLISHTKEGVAYRVDTRLRPEGSKGPLVSSIKTFRKYYAASAHFWELQALLKARPVAGDPRTGQLFLKMAHDVLTERGRDVRPADIRHMRERILRERAKEAEGYDIKLGPGGIEEIEFMVQYLQLKDCRTHQRMLVQGCLHALRRLELAGALRSEEADLLKEAYLFYRTAESFLRLRGDETLRLGRDDQHPASEFLGFPNESELEAALLQFRKDVGLLAGKYLSD